MRDVLRPGALKNAGLAATATAFACYSRLALWGDRPERLGVLLTLLFTAAFVFWAAVFAWHSKYSGRKILSLEWEPVLWSCVIVCGLAGSAILYFFVDPTLRPLAPELYPDSARGLLGMTLFTAAFTQLFVCFAPMAFFLRLTGSTERSVILTVFLGMVLVFIKMTSLQAPWLFIAGLMAFRALSGYLAATFYLRGGVLAVWVWTVLLEARHLAGFPII